MKTHKKFFKGRISSIVNTVKVKKFPGNEGYVADKCVLIGSPWTGFIHKSQKDEFEIWTLCRSSSLINKTVQPLPDVVRIPIQYDGGTQNICI